MTYGHGGDGVIPAWYLDYDGRDNRCLEEVREFHEMTKRLEVLTGASHVSVFALVQDDDNLFDAGVDVWHEECIRFSELEIFAASRLSHLPYDVVDLREERELEEL